MRDPKRINEVLHTLASAWCAHPDMRLTQLLINMGVVPDSGAWFIEDDTTLDRIRDWKEKYE